MRVILLALCEMLGWFEQRKPENVCNTSFVFIAAKAGSLRNCDLRSTELPLHVVHAVYVYFTIYACREVQSVSARCLLARFANLICMCHRPHAADQR